MIASERGAPANYRIITFYSYKGGVGRSMALANVAALLAQVGRRVLAVDFDLEAPGLARYFEKEQTRLLQPKSATGAPGLVELILAYAGGKPFDWRDCVVEVQLPGASAPISFIPAGRSGSDYATQVQSLNWDRLFHEHRLGEYLNRLREEWRETYDFVLIDSRTGMSDIGGICTIILPDALVVFFTANNQSIEGTAEVVRRARSAQETLPVERSRLLAIPMLSRDDRRTEYEQSERWRKHIVEVMSEFFRDWVLEKVPFDAVLHRLYLPQVAYWSFGERMPVIERPAELDDPGTLGAAYWRLASLINADLDWAAITESPAAAPAALERPILRTAAPDFSPAKSEKRTWYARYWPWISAFIGLAGVLVAITSLAPGHLNKTPQTDAVTPSGGGVSSGRPPGTESNNPAPSNATGQLQAPRLYIPVPSKVPAQLSQATRVYIQYQDDKQREGAEALRKALNATQFNGAKIEAPEIELVPSLQSGVNYTQLRCVHANCHNAQELADLIKKLLRGAAIPVREVSASDWGGPAQAGEYELWFGPSAIPRTTH